MLAFARSGMKRPRRAPDREERLLHRVLGERLVAQHAQREPVGDPVVAVVQLGERKLVGARNQRDDGFVGQVGEVAGHVAHSTIERQDGSVRAGPNRSPARGE